MLEGQRSDADVLSSSGSRVLVLNEDRDACELVARLLEWGGFGTERSATLVDVPAQLGRGSFAAVVIDSLGSGVSAAFQALAEVREAPAPARDLPVVILASSDTNRLYAFQSGVDAYLVRPFHAEELVAELRTVLDRSVDERTAVREAQLS